MKANLIRVRVFPVFAVTALVVGAMTGGVAVHGMTGAPPCPPSHLAIANAPAVPDGTPPMVSVVTPGAGATISGTITVTACASDNGGVAGVQFKLDGTNLGAEVTKSPYSISWDSTAVADGSHGLTAVARDASGNAATSTALMVTVANRAGPTVAITSPASGSTTSGRIVIAATASADAIAVQFLLDGGNLGAEDVSVPYTASLDTSGLADGAHSVSATARDSAGRRGTAPAISFSTVNGVVRLTPQDASINLDAKNYSTSTQLTIYTWPAQRVANAVLMKFDLSSIPAGATVLSAVLRLSLLSSDATADTIYMIPASKLVGRNPVIAAATGYTSDGVAAWTANSCCSGGVPMAQADISTPYDTQAVDKTPGDKIWTITSMVQEWLASPSTNFGVLLDADASTLADRYRYFASTKHGDAALRPYLQVHYTTGSVDTTPPVLSLVAATAIGTSAATVTWASDEGSDSQVDYGTSSAYGTTTPLVGGLATAHSVALSGLSAGTVYHFRVRSRDAAGNLAVSGDATFTTLAAIGGLWPHEPAGLGLLTDWGVGALAGGGWNTVNAGGYASIVTDTSAGVSAPAVGQWRYPSGFAGGSAPATMYYPLPASFDEGFVGLEWKPSSPWQGHASYVNKIYFLLGGSCGNLIPIMYGPPGGPYDLRVAPEWGSSWNFLTPNVNNVSVTLGAWHKIELYFKYNSAGTGVVRWWMDNTLIGDYTNVTFPASGCFSEFQLSPTWGGVGDTKSETDYFWFDHVHISRPGG